MCSVETLSMRRINTHCLVFIDFVKSYSLLDKLLLTILLGHKNDDIDSFLAENRKLSTQCKKKTLFYFNNSIPIMLQYNIMQQYNNQKSNGKLGNA